MVVAIAGVLVVGVVATTGWRWRHPTVFPEQGSYGFSSGRGQVPQVIGLGQVHVGPDGPHVLTLHRLQAAVTRRPEGTEVRFLRCHPIRTQQAEVGMGSLADAEELCELTPVGDGSTLDVSGERRDYLLMEVTLDRPGTFHAAGYEVTYSAGWQTGVQQTGPDITIVRKGDAGRG